MNTTANLDFLNISSLPHDRGICFHAIISNSPIIDILQIHAHSNFFFIDLTIIYDRVLWLVKLTIKSFLWRDAVGFIECQFYCFRRFGSGRNSFQLNGSDPNGAIFMGRR